MLTRTFIASLNLACGARPDCEIVPVAFFLSSTLTIGVSFSSTCSYHSHHFHCWRPRAMSFSKRPVDYRLRASTDELKVCTAHLLSSESTGYSFCSHSLTLIMQWLITPVPPPCFHAVPIARRAGQSLPPSSMNCSQAAPRRRHVPARALPTSIYIRAPARYIAGSGPYLPLSASSTPASTSSLRH